MNSKTNKNATDSSPLAITTLNDLISFRNRVNNGEDFHNKTILQVCDIEELNQWVPIGTMENPFRGSYFGQNQIIKKITVKSETVAGFFGCMEGGAIQDVHIVQGSIVGNKAGGICGHIRFNGKIERCSNASAVKGVGTNAYAGGICGDSWGGTLLSCMNSGEISNESPDVSSLSGGIAGANYEGKVESCTNKGSISPLTGHAGGIIASNNNGRISNCKNEQMVHSGRNKGGICGWNNGEVEKCTSSINMNPIGEGHPMK